jgi:hypothetical protein
MKIQLNAAARLQHPLVAADDNKAEYDKLAKENENFQQYLQELTEAYGPGKLYPEERKKLQGYKDKIAQNKKKMTALDKLMKKSG